MKIEQKELQALEDMLGTYRNQHGDVTIKRDATNCSGGCYMSCLGGCSGSCQGTCSVWAR